MLNNVVSLHAKAQPAAAWAPYIGQRVNDLDGGHTGAVVGLTNAVGREGARTMAWVILDETGEPALIDIDVLLPEFDDDIEAAA